MSFPRTRSRFGGFTLIELLVAISIIGLLISILLPALSTAKERGQETKCRAHMRMLGTAFMSYAQGNGDFLCSGSFDPDVANGRDGPVDQIGWVADLVNLNIANPGQMLCPSNVARYNQKLTYYSQQEASDLVRRGYNTNYTQSWFMARTEWNPASGDYNLKRVSSTIGALNLSSLKNVTADKVPLIGEGRTDNDERVLGQRVVKSLTDGPQRGPYGIQSYADFGPAHGRGSWIGTDKQHNRIRASVAFADGHCGYFEDRDRDGVFGISYATTPASQKDLKDVFDGVLSFGRRSQDVWTLR